MVSSSPANAGALLPHLHEFEFRMITKLKCKLALDAQQDAASPFLVTFELQNAGSEPVYVLRRRTPLEGLRSNCLTVKASGAAVPYDGILVKRGPVQDSEYELVAPGKAATGTVDLSKAYQVSRPGKYEVDFQGSVKVLTHGEFRAMKRGKSKGVSHTDVEVRARKRTFRVKGARGRATIGEVNRSSSGEEPSLKKSSKKKKATPKPPKLVGGTAARKKAVKAAHTAGYKLITGAISTLANDADYKEWFGKHTNGRFKIVKSVYTKSRDGMAGKTFTYKLDGGPDCEPGDVAYTSFGSTTIWLCSGFWSLLSTGTDSQAGTVLHEHTHAAADTEDYEYGQTDCRKLAKSAPNKAVDNADNFEYYAGG